MLHTFGACGKTVHEVCTTLRPLAHFSLAPFASIGDNPALSPNGTAWRPDRPSRERDNRGTLRHPNEGRKPEVYRRMRMGLLSTAFSHLWK
jgi:hypothetical protein